ncbi:nucleotidyltransferase domain-containing protein [Rathayibacter oskolensis]|uniref:nucleotidyltransferase domain-containing protein n=1 Tax=Rathayibacter oskolensis TaxID=1891671 RepID=UPI00265F6CD3|nr:nucleotidyltransferase domain-containing protein [Rathayibacter oskolensis]WKK72697.1 nucleotidyltransferase domain-containing protein [Rathayibacter oskolensis]
MIALAHLSETLLERLVAELQGWRERPVYAALFGSAARRDMHAASDLDLFLLQPDDHSEDWDEQVATLVRRARGWTGNDPRVLQLAESDARDAAAEDPVLQSVADEGVPLVGAPGAFRRLVGAR